MNIQLLSLTKRFLGKVIRFSFFPASLVVAFRLGFLRIDKSENIQFN